MKFEWKSQGIRIWEYNAGKSGTWHKWERDAYLAGGLYSEIKYFFYRKGVSEGRRNNFQTIECSWNKTNALVFLNYLWLSRASRIWLTSDLKGLILSIELGNQYFVFVGRNLYDVNILWKDTQKCWKPNVFSIKHLYQSLKFSEDLKICSLSSSFYCCLIQLMKQHTSLQCVERNGTFFYATPIRQGS